MIIYNYSHGGETMHKEFYKEYIEKTAGVKDKAISFASKNKKLLVGAGVAGAGLGGAYLVSPSDKKEKIRHGAGVAGKSIITARMNGELQDAVKNVGGLVGTGLALKSGKSLGKAVASGGLKGMAIGDIAGAATIPTYQLYKKHKKEFGEAPDMKSVSAVMAANVLPTAALWGGIYGLKSGAKHMKDSSGLVGKTIKRGGDSVNKVMDNLADGFGDVTSSGKTTIDRIRALAPSKPRELEKLKRKHQKVGLTGDEIKRYNNMVDEYMKKQESAAKLYDELGGAEGFKKVMQNDMKGIGSGVGKVTKAFLPLGLAAEVAAAPTYVVTPGNVIEAKKRKLRENNQE